MPEPLPTRQRNALRLLLDQHEFSPQDVAQLDYRHLLKSPGVGCKGVEIVRKWLAQFQLDLHRPPSANSRPVTTGPSKRVEQAIRLLERHGYVVQQANPK